MRHPQRRAPPRRRAGSAGTRRLPPKKAATGGEADDHDGGRDDAAPTFLPPHPSSFAPTPLIAHTPPRWTPAVAPNPVARHYISLWLSFPCWACREARLHASTGARLHASTARGCQTPAARRWGPVPLGLPTLRPIYCRKLTLRAPALPAVAPCPSLRPAVAPRLANALSNHTCAVRGRLTHFPAPIAAPRSRIPSLVFISSFPSPPFAASPSPAPPFTTCLPAPLFLFRHRHRHRHPNRSWSWRRSLPVCTTWG